MNSLKNIIKKILSEQEEGQLTFDFPGEITSEKAMKSLKRNFIKIIRPETAGKRWGSSNKNQPWYHTGGGYGTDSPEELISLYSKNLGTFPLMFRVNKFDPSIPIRVEYRGTSKKGKMFADVLTGMDSETFLNFINQEPFNYNFIYSTDNQDINDLERSVKPMFITLDKWLKNQSEKNWRGYDRFKDADLIKKFFKDVMGIEDQTVVNKLTTWYLRTKTFSKEKSSFDVDIQKYGEDVSKYEFEFEKKNVPCDYKVSGYVLAKNEKEAERLIKMGATDKMFWIRNSKPKCLKQNTYQEGDVLKKLRPGGGADGWSYQSVGKIK
jgi:hypothetical protein